MADLTGAGSGRAANGGARTTAGPVPVTQTDRSNMVTPQDIMRRRREREARRLQTEAEERAAADEQRKQEEERRRSAERRAQAAGVAGAPTTTASASTRQAGQTAPLRYDSHQATHPPVGGGGVPRQPERIVPTSGGPVNAPVAGQDTSSGAQYGRPRASSQAQQSHPRPAPGYDPTPAAAGDSRRPPPIQQHNRRPSAAAGPSQAGPSTANTPGHTANLSGSQPRNSTTSTFPHAFERWETLSSHWEGLTSYWIHRLEQNTDEVRRDPLVQQLSRQITDLSAAGANLFHAVVELQRLRASSERKFQRWFYEHRQEQERAQESQAQLENTIRVEQEARQDAVANMERMAVEKKNADRMVAEMRRELQISKEEARRAWEELGRREQEERDRTFALREGQPISIAGVQVVPMGQGVGRQGSVRTATGEGAYTPGMGGGESTTGHYTYEEAQSPTDTDPFYDGRQGTPRAHEPERTPAVPETYVPRGAAASSSSSTARPAPYSQAGDQPQVPVPAPLHPHHASTAQPSPSQTQTSRPEAFYQQPEAYLHRETATSTPGDERSYVTSHGEETSEGDEEYAIDEYGNFILDEQGHRVPYRSLRQTDSDEFDVHEDRRRELEHLQRYGTAPQVSSSYATTSGAGPSHGYTSSDMPDYSGAGYGSEWAGMRHHHPTRLSDVLEEDERSRTSPSRASQASRGRY